ncbi:GAL83 [Candida margitis]|uniref:GAL83 n=1 Tax=Candida margitis TaxID=1775924 RepID=UPI0022275D32|nr:GAL83 [Candida margitis]KAI5970600.1 GAL83 [Candida margitis]
MMDNTQTGVQDSTADNNSSTNANKDVSMVDVSRVHGEGQPINNDTNTTVEPQPVRRKSTLILTDDADPDQMNIDKKETDQGGDEQEEDRMHVDSSSSNLQENNQGVSERHPSQPQPQPQDQNAPSQQQQQQQPSQSLAPPHSEKAITVPVDIQWVQRGEKVYVTGSFTGWRKMIGLVKQPDGNFVITLGLPVGTHRFRFVVDNELRFSDFLPTATDQMGNFVNYIEITPENVQQHLDEQYGIQEDHPTLPQQPQQQPQPQQSPQQQQVQPERRRSVSSSISSRRSSTSRSRTDSMWRLTNDDDDMGNGYSRYHDNEEDDGIERKFEYINDIPPIFTDPKVMEQYYVAIEKQSRSNSGQQQAWLHPPQLPPHLESVILNNFNSNDNNSGALPIPNHVVLNHLATTSIKHNTLAVASIVRYKRKYVTQVLYAPL